MVFKGTQGQSALAYPYIYGIGIHQVIFVSGTDLTLIVVRYLVQLPSWARKGFSAATAWISTQCQVGLAHTGERTQKAISAEVIRVLSAINSL